MLDPSKLPRPAQTILASATSPIPAQNFNALASLIPTMRIISPGGIDIHDLLSNPSLRSVVIEAACGTIMAAHGHQSQSEALSPIVTAIHRDVPETQLLSEVFNGKLAGIDALPDDTLLRRYFPLARLEPESSFQVWTRRWLPTPPPNISALEHDLRIDATELAGLLARARQDNVPFR